MKTVAWGRVLVTWCAMMASLWLVPAASAGEIVGQRPYEMVWANRTSDSRLPLVDFENLDGWAATASDAVASFAITREQQLWGQHVGRLTYRARGSRHGSWCGRRGPCRCRHRWTASTSGSTATTGVGSPTPPTPPVNIIVLLQSRSGQLGAGRIGSVRWHEWWVMHRKLTAEQESQLKDGSCFAGFEITNGHNRTTG